MLFASCRIQQDRVLVLGYEKEYNRTVSCRFTVLSLEEATAQLAQYEYLDILVPAQEVLYFAGNYPSVKRSDLEKIVLQDIESATPFKAEEVVFDIGALRDDGLIPVFSMSKERLRAILDRLGPALRERVRTIIPEEALLPSGGEKTQALFVDDQTSVFVSEKGQVVRNIGLARLAAMMRESLGRSKSEEETLQILASAMDLTDGPALSEDELLLRKAAERFFHELAAEFGRFLHRGPRTMVYFADRLPGSAEKLVSNVIHGALAVSAEEALERVNLLAEGHERADLARSEFSYRGGLSFLKRRIMMMALLFVLGFILLFAAFEVRLWQLDMTSSTLDDNARVITKEVLGKEYPSLRQAISVMQKTVGGGGKEGKNDKKLYPYSAVFVMEQVFPAAVFEGSSVEVRDFSFKDGKVKLTGEADSLEHINTMVENLEKIEYVSELNKGQITSRGGKNSFGISFSFQKKVSKEKEKKESKKETEKTEKAEKTDKVDKTEKAEQTPEKSVEEPIQRPSVAPPSVVAPKSRDAGGAERVPWEEEQQ